MDNTYWSRQTDGPLFEDILWSRPENKRLAKKMVIVGGHTGSFMHLATSYQQVLDAGIGSCRVVLPDRLQRVVGKSIEDVVFLPSDSSGGISKDASVMMHEYSEWGNGVYFPGDLGHGSEATRFVEKFVGGTTLPLVLSGDSLDVFYDNPTDVFNKENTVLVLSMRQLQKMAPHLEIETPIVHTMDLVRLVEVLHEITKERESMLVTHHDGNTIVAMYGEVSTTPVEANDDWQLATASRAAVFFLQHPEKPFQSVTASLVNESAQ